jgi:hypothetical protein
MSAGKRIKPDDKEQSKLFMEKAREIEADETTSEADKLLGRLAKMKREPRRKPQPKQSSSK